MKERTLNSRNIVACLWDFDKTLIPGYMQSPLFKAYGIDEKRFWKEVNELPKIYANRGCHVSRDTVYLNHLLSFIKNGSLKGLTNSRLRTLGEELEFYPGLPDFFHELRQVTVSKPEFRKHDITLEHYIISTGLAEMIRGSAIADFVDGIFGCEFIEAPLPPNFSQQSELPLEMTFEISQIGSIVDNTIKTRFIFEVNKGTNRNPQIDVNASMSRADRRIPIDHMIYVADGPSDVPVFSVVKGNGGRTFAVFDPSNPAEFAQNDNLLAAGRINAYGPADYRSNSTTAMWLKMHVAKICDQIVEECEEALSNRVMSAPTHLHKPEAEDAALKKDPAVAEQAQLFDE
jgi:hypothetical protein